MLHTHPAGAGSTLKGKRTKKADTNDGQKAKTAQGREGNERTSRTNLHGETDLTKTGHTPKPHDTLQRGTGEYLGTEWETSWRQEVKQQIKGTQSQPMESCINPNPERRVQVTPHGPNGCSSSNELGAQHVLPHQEPKKPNLQEEGMPATCHDSCRGSL